MKTTIRTALTLVVSALVMACGSSSSPEFVSSRSLQTSDEPIAIVEVIENVEYYIGCGNVPTIIDGVRWYPIPSGDWDAEVEEWIGTAERQPIPTGPSGMLRVPPPGPGEDIGTVYVYADGFAFFESDAGQTTWLTQQEQSYDWLC